MTAAMARVIGRLEGAREVRPGQWIARCPGHDDAEPSFAVSTGRGDRVLTYCRAGCTTRDVLRAIGLEYRDLFADAVPARAVPARSIEDQARVEVYADERRRREKLAAYIEPGGIYEQADSIRGDRNAILGDWRYVYELRARVTDSVSGWALADRIARHTRELLCREAALEAREADLEQAIRRAQRKVA